jgi:hypothetical protein
MIGNWRLKILFAILTTPAAALLLWVLCIILSPLILFISPKAAVVLIGAPFLVAHWAAGCDIVTAGRTPIPSSPWVVEERWEHCSALDRSPDEIVAINAKKHQEIRIAIVDVQSNYGPGFGLDDRGQVVVVVPKGSTVGDRRDEVLGLKVIYKSYDGYDGAMREKWMEWQADPKNPALAEWYRRQPDFPPPEPGAAK